jgi:hypothetical protein
MEKNLQRICAKVVFLRKVLRVADISTASVFGNNRLPPCRSRAGKLVGSETRAVMFSLASQSTVVFDGGGCQAKRKCFGDAFTFVRDLLLDTVLAPSPQTIRSRLAKRSSSALGIPIPALPS